MKRKTIKHGCIAKYKKKSEKESERKLKEISSIFFYNTNVGIILNDYDFER